MVRAWISAVKVGLPNWGKGADLKYIKWYQKVIKIQGKWLVLVLGNKVCDKATKQACGIYRLNFEN